MLSASVWILSLAVVAGSVLGMLHLRASEGVRRPPLWMGIAHGLTGAVGLALLVPVLRGPPRGAASGTTTFGPMAGWLFVAALATGALLLARRKRGPALTMVVHAGLAVTGWVLLLAWNALG